MTFILGVTRWRPVTFGLLAAALGTYVAAGTYLHAPLGTPGPDFDQAWWMAREILQGHDPYAADATRRVFGSPIFYPLTVAIVALPLSGLPVTWARLCFVAGTAAILGYAMGRHRPYLWPTLLGMPYLVALRSAQWSPLLTAAMLLPVLGWLGAAKPNLGVAMLAWMQTKRSILLLAGGGLVLVAVSLAVDPAWPWKWRTALAQSTHFAPLLFHPGGFLVLLALLRWRDRDARLLLALGVVPMTGLFYDVLPACLVCRSRKDAALLALASHVSWMAAWVPPVTHSLAERMWVSGNLVLWFSLLPAVGILLARHVPKPDWTGRGRRPSPAH